MAGVVDNLLEAHSYDDGEGVLVMLHGQDMRNSLVDDSALPTADPDRLAGPFVHIVVDEAQELTDAERQMLLRRCPSRSFTVVGDRTQARHGFTESWRERLERVGLDRIERASLSIKGRQRADVDPQRRRPRPSRVRRGADVRPRRVAVRARRRDRLCDRRSRLPARLAPRPVTDAGTVEGSGVRPGRARRPGVLRRRRRGRPSTTTWRRPGRHGSW
ncbi:hypothetical protein GCM10010104_58050 [Streptomyces indiaensis]|uniref:DNA helicase n=1 Tax=Streptomyces indiaensis TaxID=284033 RepID=A0ABP5R9T5_9ACTN